MATTEGKFIPEFVLDEYDEPIALSRVSAEPEPACRHWLPKGFGSDITMYRTTASGRRGEIVTVLAPAGDPLPPEKGQQALAGRALIRASWRETYPNGYTHTCVGWALMEGDHLIAKDEYFADRGIVMSRVREGKASEDIAVFDDVRFRVTPPPCPICGQPDWRG